LGHEFSAGLAYLNIRLGAGNMFGLGYKIKYGIRFYCHKNERKNRWFYISPQFFYKQLWLKNRNENSDNYGLIGYGGADSYDEYLYSENRQVYAGQIILGWKKSNGHRAHEFYIGFGCRYYNSYQQITEWLHSRAPGIPLANLPKTSEHLAGLSPSIHLGWNASFPFHKKKE
jgi:hypothetical protein